ncbi:hypothetical protein SAMN02745121_02852 [Nannocystis exedens]|uniref:Tetratricopeptide repeat-containing protein n=1 Tax=Nannocystis exedens TaxID=54 RepID=A0A1I1XIS1_9BACT|nr:hypothetical protein [Nannocystis exedens]PCC73419.1 hypothetical protein NAEX_06507 [Nannocystis exedens]SFE06538.1 hypothetical protein SAMN02745121_02852 [Nannocystis exedens]
MEELDRSAHELLREYRVGAGLDAPARARVWQRLEDSIEACPLADVPPARRPRDRKVIAVLVGSLAAALLLFVCDRRGLREAGRGTDAEAAAYAAERAAGEARERGSSNRPAQEEAGPTPAATDTEAAAPAPAAPADDDGAARLRGGRGGPRARGAAESPDRKDMPEETGPRGQSGLAAEMALLRRARAALDGGDPGAALHDLAAHERAFAAGQMLQDRLLLRMEALCALGKGRQARAEAAVFLRTYPESTHTARVQTICPESPNGVTD